MKAQKKRSKEKERFKYYKGQMIWVNSTYLSPKERKGKFNVGLFYCPLSGNDIYFESVGKVKRYIDSILQEFFKWIRD